MLLNQEFTQIAWRYMNAKISNNFNVRLKSFRNRSGRRTNPLASFKMELGRDSWHGFLQAQGPDLSDPRSFLGQDFHICFIQVPQRISMIVLCFSPSEVMLSHGICVDGTFHCFQAMSRSRFATVHMQFPCVTWLNAPWGWDEGIWRIFGC